MRPGHKKVALLAAGAITSGVFYIIKEALFEQRQKENRKRYKENRKRYWERGR